jgi:hypothetical protein
MKTLSEIPTPLFVICGLLVLFCIAVLLPIIWLGIQLVRQKLNPSLSEKRGWRYLGLFEP